MNYACMNFCTTRSNCLHFPGLSALGSHSRSTGGLVTPHLGALGAWSLSTGPDALWAWSLSTQSGHSPLSVGPAGHWAWTALSLVTQHWTTNSRSAEAVCPACPLQLLRVRRTSPALSVGNLSCSRRNRSFHSSSPGCSVSP